jgi:hypothetical protein
MLFCKYRPVEQLKQLFDIAPLQVKHDASHFIQDEHGAVVHALFVVMK